MHRIFSENSIQATNRQIFFVTKTKIRQFTMKKVVAGIAMLLFSLVLCTSAETCENKDECAKDQIASRRMIERDGFFQRRVERVSRMVNIRGRVGSERLVNNRRIVDSDSRLSNFPEMQRDLQDRRNNINQRETVERIADNTRQNRWEITSHRREARNIRATGLESRVPETRNFRVTEATKTKQTRDRRYTISQERREDRRNLHKNNERRTIRDDTRLELPNRVKEPKDSLRFSDSQERSEERQNVNDHTVASRRSETSPAIRKNVRLERNNRVLQLSDRTRSSEERRSANNRVDASRTDENSEIRSRSIRNNVRQFSDQTRSNEERNDPTRTLSRAIREDIRLERKTRAANPRERTELSDNTRSTQERSEERRNFNDYTDSSRIDERQVSRIRDTREDVGLERKNLPQSQDRSRTSQERQEKIDYTVPSRRDERQVSRIRDTREDVRLERKNLPQAQDRSRTSQERREKIDYTVSSRRDERQVSRIRDTREDVRLERKNLPRSQERSRTSQERREKIEHTVPSRKDERLETRRVRLMERSESRRTLETSKGIDENNNIVYRSYLNQDYKRLDTASSKLFTTLAVILVLGQIVHSQLDSKRFYRLRHLFTTTKEKVC